MAPITTTLRKSIILADGAGVTREIDLSGFNKALTPHGVVKRTFNSYHASALAPTTVSKNSKIYKQGRAAFGFIASELALVEPADVAKYADVAADLLTKKVGGLEFAVSELDTGKMIITFDSWSRILIEDVRIQDVADINAYSLPSSSKARAVVSDAATVVDVSTLLLHKMALSTGSSHSIAPGAVGVDVSSTPAPPRPPRPMGSAVSNAPPPRPTGSAVSNAPPPRPTAGL